jgi:hypothetical protein
VKRALAALFKGAVGKDVVSRTWRKVKADWEGWNRRDLSGEDIVRLILDGTVVKARIDRKATSISLLVVLGIRRAGSVQLALDADEDLIHVPFVARSRPAPFRFNVLANIRPKRRPQLRMLS